MEATAIRRQYDDVISARYDADPQCITNKALDRAIGQIRNEGLLQAMLPTLRVLDVGMGTGIFLQKLRQLSARSVEPSGIDISEKMVEIARNKLPDLAAAVDDGANIDLHFIDRRFDLVATHFVTGFVPIEHLAPRIHHRLSEQGYWSFVGGTSAGYTALQQRASHPLVRLLFGGRRLDLQSLICPDSEPSVTSVMGQFGFEVLHTETWCPQLRFADFDEFMEYAYHGGWLTPFIEQLGLHQARPWQQSLLNRLVFPIVDHHSIVLILARKLAE